MRRDFEHVELRPPAPETAVAAAEHTLGRALPASLLDLYRESDGLTTDDGVLIYGAGEIVERNQTLEVAVYAPGHLAVGDDGGGRTLLLSPSDVGCWVDMGSMDPSGGVPLAMTFAAWLEAGLPLLVETERPGNAVDICLESVPTGGLKAMFQLKKHLGIPVGATELRDLMNRVPACLKEGLSQDLAERLCREFNTMDPCLGIRPHPRGPVRASKDGE